jgi:hypothetical protein
LEKAEQLENLEKVKAEWTNILHIEGHHEPLCILPELEAKYDYNRIQYFRNMEQSLHFEAMCAIDTYNRNFPDEKPIKQIKLHDKKGINIIVSNNFLLSDILEKPILKENIKQNDELRAYKALRWLKQWDIQFRNVI